MKTYTLSFQPHNISIEVPEGETILRGALEAGVHINASCGGEGVCGKCRVIIEKGRVAGGIGKRLSQEDLDKGYRIACQSVPETDLTVRIPVESSVDASVLNLRMTPRQTAKIKQTDLNTLKEQGLFVPPVEKIYIELPEPSADDRLPDVTRLVSFLKLDQDEHRLVVNLPVIRKIPDILREGDFKVTATLERPVQKGRKTHIINVQPGDASKTNYAIAIDIGTTTVYGQLIDLISGEIISENGDFNEPDQLR